MLLEVDYADGFAERYQVLVSWDAEPPPEYHNVALIGADDGRTGYDGLYDPQVTAFLLELIDSSAARSADLDRIDFTAEPDSALPLGSGPGSVRPNSPTPASSSGRTRSSRCSVGCTRASTPTSS